MDKELVKGKIAVCDSFVTPKRVGSNLKGAIGVIMQDTTPKDLTFPFPLPASHLTTNDGALISSYLNSNR